MADRASPLRLLIRAGLFDHDLDVYNYFLPLAEDWDAIARLHTHWRNESAGVILAHLAILVALHPTLVRRQELAVTAELWPELHEDFVPTPPAAETGPQAEGSGATVQTPRPAGTFPVPARWKARMEALELTPEQQARFEKKLTAVQRAHQAPCQILIDNQPIQRHVERLDRAEAARLWNVAALTRRFAMVDPLPTLFNEVDSQVERANLRFAFLDAAQLVMRDTRGSDLGVVWVGGLSDTVRRAYERFLDGAKSAIAQALARNNEELASATAAGDRYEQIYREGKVEILERYLHYTTNPELSFPDRELIMHFWSLH